jgi:superfamily II DNA or RNA helicase
MSFRQLNLKSSYDSGVDDILWDFYIPTLSMANRYDRIAGFFSSSSLAVSAKGLKNFILNHGSMRLVTCPKLNMTDVELIENRIRNIDEVLYTNFIKDINSIETQFQRDHVSALGWMLEQELLDIRIAVIKRGNKLCSADEIERSGIMHQKVGIMYDSNGDIISFSGSNNESASGWCNNIEEFKVFNNWQYGEAFFENYIRPDQIKFDDFWNSKRRDVEMKKLPEAIKEHLLEISHDFEPEYIDYRKYYKSSTNRELQPKEELKLFFYQKDAVEKWENNGRRLLLEMATGCGKTRTAIGCMKKVFDEKKPILVVVSCPMKNLSMQWKDDIESLDIIYDQSIVVNGDVAGWRIKLSRELSKLSVGRYKSLIVFTTHGICSDEKFIESMRGLNRKIDTFIIGDEVHGMGAHENRKGLLEIYKYRLGLSATPSRWFDEYGSQLILGYFGGDAYVFSIHDALITHNPLTNKPYLVNFTYNAKFIEMTPEELFDYKSLSDRINRLSSFKDTEHQQEGLQRMLFKRAEIEKVAENKYRALIEILDEIMRKETLDNTIIFVAPQQMERVQAILKQKNISYHRYTQEHGTVSEERYGGVSERKNIENHFKKCDYQVLLAVKCLDEGIDIPTADRAIIMASSTNPREYVQRTGRIIRQAPGKYRAELYDIIIRPSLDAFDNENMAQLEKTIFEKELVRVKDLAMDSIDNSLVFRTIQRMLREVT